MSKNEPQILNQGVHIYEEIDEEAMDRASRKLGIPNYTLEECAERAKKRLAENPNIRVQRPPADHYDVPEGEEF